MSVLKVYTQVKETMPLDVKVGVMMTRNLVEYF